MKEPKLNIPVLFQKLDEFATEDTRFIKVKIWLMHIGENFNGSYFDKEVVEKAIPSLANTPILGFIEENSQGDDDFSDHRRVMHRDKDGNWHFKYLGQAYGVIPETNNAKFEHRLCDDGVTREFLTVEGLLWTKWKEPIDIMNRDIIKSESMEIHDDYEGYFDENDNLFHFTKFKFFGACILGLDVLPAMQNATVELYSLSNITKEIQEKMEEYKLYQQNKGGQGMDKKLELIAKYSKSKEDIEAMGINLEEISFEDLEAKLKEVVKSDDTDDSNDDTSNTNADDNSKDSDTDDNTNSDNSDNNDDNKDDGANVDDNADNGDNSDDGADDGSDDPVNEDYQKLYEELKEEYDKLQENYTALKEEVEGLREFKNTKLAQERKEAEDALFEQYKELDGIDEYEAIKAKASEFATIEDLEKEIALIFVRNKAKLNFSKANNSEKNNSNRFNFDNDEPKTTKYGDLFERYGNK